MGVKSRVLALLEEKRGQRLSGEELAEEMGVSRAAVWKAVQALRAEGWEIESTTGSGYRLPQSSDKLSEQALRAFLGGGDCPVRVLESTGSTNTEAKRWAIEGAPHGALVLAEKQEGGKGRRGRAFASPPGGIYMSVVLRPRHPLNNSMLITAAGAVAVCRAVERVCGLSLSIKWVNDLFYKAGKCCGILTEAGTGFEAGTLDYIVVGLGLNYTTAENEFPPELAPVARALYPCGPAPAPRAALAAAIHSELLALYESLPKREFLEEYRSRSLVLGRRVKVMDWPPYEAWVEGIDENAHLLVRREDGTKRELYAGEISIRMEEDA